MRSGPDNENNNDPPRRSIDVSKSSQGGRAGAGAGGGPLLQRVLVLCGVKPEVAADLASLSSSSSSDPRPFPSLLPPSAHLRQDGLLCPAAVASVALPHIKAPFTTRLLDGLLDGSGGGPDGEQQQVVSAPAGATLARPHYNPIPSQHRGVPASFEDDASPTDTDGPTARDTDREMEGRDGDLESSLRHEQQQQRALLCLLPRVRAVVDIAAGRRSLLVLIGGTSGTGKSSVASLVAARLGIATVIATDHVREALREQLRAAGAEKAFPALFLSSYQAHAACDGDAVNGFRAQAALVQPAVRHLIERYARRGESCIVEGVHLTPAFMATTTAALLSQTSWGAEDRDQREGEVEGGEGVDGCPPPVCVPFLAYIRKESAHRGRFATRSPVGSGAHDNETDCAANSSRGSAIRDPSNGGTASTTNRYLADLPAIRAIQDYLIAASTDVLTGCLDRGGDDSEGEGGEGEGLGGGWGLAAGPEGAAPARGTAAHTSAAATTSSRRRATRPPPHIGSDKDKEEDREEETNARRMPSRSAPSSVRDCSGSSGSGFPICRLHNTNIDRTVMRLHAHVLKVVDLHPALLQQQTTLRSASAAPTSMDADSHNVHPTATPSRSSSTTARTAASSSFSPPLSWGSDPLQSAHHAHMYTHSPSLPVRCLHTLALECLRDHRCVPTTASNTATTTAFPTHALAPASRRPLDRSDASPEDAAPHSAPSHTTVDHHPATAHSPPTEERAYHLLLTPLPTANTTTTASASLSMLQPPCPHHRQSHPSPLPVLLPVEAMSAKDGLRLIRAKEGRRRAHSAGTGV